MTFEELVLAGVFGPWLLRAAFGAEYRADGALLAWLTAAAVAIALLTLTGAAAVAAALHRAYSALKRKVGEAGTGETR